MDEKEWLSVDGLAEWFGIPAASIYRWRAERRGPVGHRVGRRVLYRKADIERWLTEQRDVEDQAV